MSDQNKSGGSIGSFPASRTIVAPSYRVTRYLKIEYSISNTEGTTPNSASSPPLTPESEQTFSLLTSHRSVLRYLFKLLTRGPQVTIIRHSGAVFEGD